MDRTLQAVAILAISTLGMTCAAKAEDFEAKFSGFEELGALNAETGAVLSNGTAKLTVKLDKKLQKLPQDIEYFIRDPNQTALSILVNAQIAKLAGL